MAATLYESMNVITHTTTTRHGNIWGEPAISRYTDIEPTIKIKNKPVQRKVIISRTRRKHYGKYRNCKV